jgi:hypothetical protein
MLSCICFAGAVESIDRVFGCGWALLCPDTADLPEHLTKPQISSGWTRCGNQSFTCIILDQIVDIIALSRKALL